MLNVWSPWQDFDRLRSEVDRLFGRYATAGYGEQSMVVRPALRLRELEDAYRLSVDLPGVRAEAIDLECQGQWLRLRATRGSVEDGGEIRYEQVLELPITANADGITTRHENGVLEILIPKPEEVKPRRVQIASHQGGQPVIEAGGAADKAPLVGAAS